MEMLEESIKTSEYLTYLVVLYLVIFLVSALLLSIEYRSEFPVYKLYITILGKPFNPR